jgi:hypothetical protein
MPATAAVFAGGTIPGPITGFMMFFVESISSKSGTNGRNGHQGGNDKHSFHNEGLN